MNSFPTLDHHASSQTNVTMDMNTVSRVHISLPRTLWFHTRCRCLCSVSHSEVVSGFPLFFWEINTPVQLTLVETYLLWIFSVKNEELKTEFTFFFMFTAEDFKLPNYLCLNCKRLCWKQSILQILALAAPLLLHWDLVWIPAKWSVLHSVLYPSPTAAETSQGDNKAENRSSSLFIHHTFRAALFSHALLS